MITLQEIGDDICFEDSSNGDSGTVIIMLVVMTKALMIKVRRFLRI